MQSESVSEKTKDRKPETPSSGRKGAYILLTVMLVLLLAGAAYKVIMDRSYTPTGTIHVSEEGLNVENTDNMISVVNPDITPANGKTGLVFYTDLQVEPECYLPLMYRLANLGYNCYLPKAFGNQPFLNIVGADSVIRKYPGTKTWYLIGHSKGCGPAASYAKDHTDLVKGLIYLGGCSTQDLTGSKLALLSLFGTKDTVTGETERSAGGKTYPPHAETQTISGGNNTGFTDTGRLLQGDSKADISAEEQINLTAELIDQFLSSPERSE